MGLGDTSRMCTKSSVRSSRLVYALEFTPSHVHGKRALWFVVVTGICSVSAVSSPRPNTQNPQADAGRLRATSAV